MGSEDMADLRLVDYRPRSELVVDAHSVERARFPVVDVHCHLGRIFMEDPDSPGRLVDLMDSVGVRAIMSLDVGAGSSMDIADTVKLVGDLRDRFVLFQRLNWSRIEEGAGFGERMAADLREAVAGGAQGVKIGKGFGLRTRDPEGRLLMPGDERMDPVFEAAGELGVPILFHIADPVAFFRPLDATNERVEELGRHPGWHFAGDEFPSFEELMAAQVRFVLRYPRTTFISAHVCSWSEDLGAVGRMLDECPNLNCDISARFSEISRQPRAALAWFTRYADRILFGSDFRPEAAMYRVAFRILETEDEYFPYSTGEVPGQGRWMGYGVGLPDDVLRKVYSGNAARIIPGVTL